MLVVTVLVDSTWNVTAALPCRPYVLQVSETPVLQCAKSDFSPGELGLGTWTTSSQIATVVSVISTRSPGCLSISNTAYTAMQNRQTWPQQWTSAIQDCLRNRALSTTLHIHSCVFDTGPRNTLSFSCAILGYVPCKALFDISRDHSIPRTIEFSTKWHAETDESSRNGDMLTKVPAWQSDNCSRRMETADE